LDKHFDFSIFEDNKEDDGLENNNSKSPNKHKQVNAEIMEAMQSQITYRFSKMQGHGSNN
jgi:hypothetical protein